MLGKIALFGLICTGSYISSVMANVVSPAQQLVQLADRYYQHSIDRAPEFAMLYGRVDRMPAQLTDNSLDGSAKYQKVQDEILTKLEGIEPDSLNFPADLVTYSILKELLENAKNTRVCRSELWSIDHMFGWQMAYPQLMTMQSVESEIDRTNIIKRWQKLPQFLENKQTNLTLGLELGYSTPKSVVRRLLKQLNGILALKVEQSPLYSPASRSQIEGFKQRWHMLIDDDIKPALINYVQFLETKYLSEAKTEVGIGNHPNGRECYMASFTDWTGLKWTPEKVYNKGKKLVAANESAVVKLGKTLWQSENFLQTIAKSKQVAGQSFMDASQMIAFSQSAEQRAKASLSEYFFNLPSAELKVEPYPDVYKGSGVQNKYMPPTDTTPYGLYQINTFTPEKASKAELEITAFHEGYPGHHMQMAIASELAPPHKIMDIYQNSAFVEGWGRYAEQLAEEIGLYHEPVAKVVRRAWPGRGMVVDPGLHLFGWTREQAVKYINDSGRWSPSYGEELVDRMAVMPAQLTSYDSGAMEFFRLRQLTSEKMGEKFDIKGFHSTLLDSGIVPLSMLDSMIKDWMKSKTSND
jgi:uncharacterized protein (DUF885 family)